MLPRSLKNLKKSAFNGSTAIKEIVVPAENEKYIMKQLPKELQALVKVTKETLVDTTPEPVIEFVAIPTPKVVEDPTPVTVEEVVTAIVEETPTPAPFETPAEETATSPVVEEIGTPAPAEVEVVAAPVAEPAPAPVAEPAAEATTQTISDLDAFKFELKKTTAIGVLKAAFHEAFGAQVRVYNGRSCAEDNVSLGEVGLTNEGTLECSPNLTAGNFVERMQTEFGLKVKVYTCDYFVAVIDGLTLEQAGKVKKNAVKKDMEALLAK